MILFLYFITISIWGSTWYVLTFQLGVVSIELSIAYRFFLAALFFFVFLGGHKNFFQTSLRDHLFFALQGFLLYCASFLCIYNAAHHIPSGLNSLIFSLVIVMNVLFAAFFFKRPLSGTLLISSAFGVLGVFCIFYPEIETFSLKQGHGIGLLLAFLACVFSALGNVTLERNRHMPVAQVNAFSMLYGAGFCFCYALFKGCPLVFDTSFSYLSSLFYLVFFGSVVAFGCYTRLINLLGAAQGGYPFVLIPLVSLLLSQFFEGIQWTPSLVLGLVFTLTGNIIILVKKNTKEALEDVSLPPRPPQPSIEKI